jgi:hypothetical protein
MTRRTWAQSKLRRKGLSNAALLFVFVGAAGCADDEAVQKDSLDAGSCSRSPVVGASCQGPLVCESTCGVLGWYGRITCENGRWVGTASPCESSDRFRDAGDGSVARDASASPSDASGIDAN